MIWQTFYFACAVVLCLSLAVFGTDINPSKDIVKPQQASDEGIDRKLQDSSSLFVGRVYPSRIKILENNVRSLSSLLQTQSVIVHSLARELKKAKADLTAKDKQLESKVNQNTNRSGTALSKANQALQKAGKWPAGHYCILRASGRCPPGFKASSAFMKAISLYAGNSRYIKQGTFGDSKIQCHGRCGQYRHWTGELYLNVCCK